MQEKQRLIRLVERYSNIKAFVGVETRMTDEELNLAGAFIQHVRSALPLMSIQWNDTMDLPEMAFALERLFDCRSVIADTVPAYDAEFDLFDNWDFAKAGTDFSNLAITQKQVAAVLIENFIEQAKEIMSRKQVPSSAQVVEYERLISLSQGGPALPEWQLEDIFDRPVVGVLV